MAYRKFLSFLLSIMMLLAFPFSAAFADAENDPSGSTDSGTIPDLAASSVYDGQGKSFDLPEGLTINLPPEFAEPMWFGMAAEDSEFTSQYGLEPVKQAYEEQGLALWCDAPPVGQDNGQLFFIGVNVADVPDEISESTFLSTIARYDAPEEGPEFLEILGQGLVKVGDIDVYKTSVNMGVDFFENGERHARYTLRIYKYSMITESGKLFDIEIQVYSDPMHFDDAIPFTDEDLAHLDYLESYIIGSIKLEGKTVSIDAAPYSASGNNGGSAFAGADENGTAYPLPEGLTITLPPEFSEPLWVGMDANDSALTAEYGMDMIKEMYEEDGITLQCDAPPVGEDNGQNFFIAVHVKDAPADVSESTFLSNVTSNQISQEKDLESLEILQKGVIHVGDVDIYKTVSEIALNFDYDVQARYKKRVYKYAFVTESGKLHEIEIELLSDPRNPDDAIPFTDEDLAHLDYLESYIIGSIKLDGKSVSIDAEPFPMNGNGNAGQKPSETAETRPATENSGSKSKNRNFFRSFTSFSFPLWILAAALVAILIAGAKVSKRHEWQEEPFALDTSKAIQGFAAVSIILHHLSQELMDKAGPFAFLSECGVLFVGIFFFFSGFGLYTSLTTKKDYLKGFFRKRFITILIPFYVCIAVFTVASCICGAKYNAKELLAVLSGWSLINGHMWYIVEIAILYLAFFIIYKLIKNRTAATCVMTVFVLAMMGGSLYLCHGKDFACRYWFMGEWWYNSSILFIVGIFVSKHREHLRKIARKAYVVLVPLFAVLTGVFGYLTVRALHKYSYWSEIPGVDPRYLDKLRCLSVQVPYIFCFVIFVLLIMMKVRFGNPVLSFLGSISLELYLIHNLFLTGLSDGTVFRVSSPSMYILLTILLAIAAATVISGTDKYLIGLLNGKKKLTGNEITPSRNHSIDFMRIVMAFLVVTIHWPFAGKAGNVFITFGKSAVPFFLVVCGYMLYRDDSKELMKRLLKQTRRIFIFFVLSNLFYAAATALYDKVVEGKVNMNRYLTGKAIKNFLLYNLPPFSEHLWFFGTLLYALLIILLLHAVKALKPAMFLGPVLIAAYVVLSHMNVAEPYKLRNAVLVGLAYTMTGMLIRRYEKKILSIKILPYILPVLAVGASIAAIIELNTYKKGVEVPFIGSEVLTIVLMLICIRFPNIGKDTYAEKLGRTCSLPIYIMHIFTMLIFLMTNNEPFFGKFGAVTIFAVTAVAVALYENVKDAVIKTKA